MTYSVKEIFYTLQGEGGQAGTPAVFCRFAGCNLWTGREQDRAQAICQFCDTDFVGTDGTLGDKFETATALAELIAGVSKPSATLVLGGGHSIGIPLAVSARHSFIVPTATMTVHPVRMSGLMLGVPQTLEYFQRMQDRITNFVTANSGISYERFMQLAMNTQELVMDVGTVLDGAEAVAEGLIDTLGSLHDAMDCLDKMIAAEKNKQRAKPRKGKKSL